MTVAAPDLGDGAALTIIRVGDQAIGLSMWEIQDVVEGLETRAAPLAPRHVAGLANHGGRVATIIDLRRRLGLASRPAGGPRSHVMVEHDGSLYGLEVDSVEATVTVRENVNAAFLPEMDEIMAAAARAVYRVSSGWLIAMSAATLIASAADGAETGDRTLEDGRASADAKRPVCG